MAPVKPRWLPSGLAQAFCEKLLFDHTVNITMKLAFIGINSASLPLLAEAVGSATHDVVAVCEAGSYAAQVTNLSSEIDQSLAWECLLGEVRVDAVVISPGSDMDLRGEQLRRLAVEAIGTLVVGQVCESIVCYEIEMIRADTKACLVPYVPGRSHPAIVRMQELVTGQGSSSLGRVEQVIFERTVTDRRPVAVLQQLTCDVSLLQAIVGKVNRVTAMAGSTGDESFANLNVQLSCPEGTGARWSIGPVSGSPGGTIVLVSERGRAVLTMPTAGSDWQLELTVGDDVSSQTWPDWDEPATALERLQRSIQGESPDPDWVANCRDTEISESAERSLQRGRAIDILDSDRTEHQTFKGMMAAGGCLLLLGLLFVLVVGAVIDSVVHPRGAIIEPEVATTAADGLFARLTRRNPMQLATGICLLTPLALFLGLQLLKLVFYSKDGADKSA